MDPHGFDRQHFDEPLQDDVAARAVAVCFVGDELDEPAQPRCTGLVTRTRTTDGSSATSRVASAGSNRKYPPSMRIVTSLAAMARVARMIERGEHRLDVGATPQSELGHLGKQQEVATPQLENYHVSEDNWRDALISDRADGHPTAPPPFAESESPRYVGRASPRWRPTRTGAAGTSSR